MKWKAAKGRSKAPEVNKDVSKQLDQLQYSSQNPEEVSQKLAKIIRDYFSEKLKLKYQFTFQELSDEIASKRVSKELKPKIKDLSELLSTALYKGHFSEEEFNHIRDEFKVISQKMVVDEAPKAKRGFIRFFHKGKKGVKMQEKSESDACKNVLKMIDEAHKHIENHEVSIAKTIVPKIVKIHGKLNPEEKQKVHENLVSLYDKIKKSSVDPPKPAPVNNESVPKPLPPAPPKAPDVEKKGFFSSLFKKKSDTALKTEDKKTPLAPKPSAVKGDKNAVEVNIKEAERLLDDGDVSKAKKQIHLVCDEIEKLPVEERHVYHKDIAELYRRVKEFTSKAQKEKTTSPSISIASEDSKLNLAQKERDRLFSKMQKELSSPTAMSKKDDSPGSVDKSVVNKESVKKDEIIKKSDKLSREIKPALKDNLVNEADSKLPVVEKPKTTSVPTPKPVTPILSKPVSPVAQQDEIKSASDIPKPKAFMIHDLTENTKITFNADMDKPKSVSQPKVEKKVEKSPAIKAPMVKPVVPKGDVSKSKPVSSTPLIEKPKVTEVGGPSNIKVESSKPKVEDPVKQPVVPTEKKEPVSLPAGDSVTKEKNSSLADKKEIPKKPVNRTMNKVSKEKPKPVTKKLSLKSKLKKPVKKKLISIKKEVVTKTKLKIHKKSRLKAVSPKKIVKHTKSHDKKGMGSHLLKDIDKFLEG